MYVDVKRVTTEEVMRFIPKDITGYKFLAASSNIMIDGKTR